jgi:trehalose synthase
VRANGKANLTHVQVESADIERYRPILGEPPWGEFTRSMSELEGALRGRTVWNVNSTARGGGVAELLASLIPYDRGAGIDERWVVIEGSPEFFEVTKRIHNLLHGVSSDGAGFSAAERATYESTMKRNVDALADVVRGGDVVILHDPQTAGLVPALSALGAIVIWRSHVGIDEPNDFARAAWGLLRPYLDTASALVFSRRSYVWDGLETSKVQVIAPCIDAFATKNRELTDGEMGKLLAEAGITAGGRMVLQVSRWDRLKDPTGVLRAFADHIAQRTTDTCLVLAGPAATSVRDDPEQPEVLSELLAQQQALDASVASRVRIVQLPMEDQDENAGMVNALQRRADVVVQKSLAEGFGLTVAESMWKARPVVASSVGGIIDQIEDGESGLLVEPKDLDAFGHAVTVLVNDRDRAARIGAAARIRVREQFLAPRHLMEQGRLIGTLL